MAKKNPPEPETLQLRTLAGNYEAARAVVRLTHIDSCSTYSQLARRLQQLAKDSAQVKELYIALERLASESLVLGLTTLVRPQDHPLFMKHRYTTEEDE